MTSKKCWVCEGIEPKAYLNSYRCEKHDVCDVCKTKRKDLKDSPWGKKYGFICQPCEEKRCQSEIDKFNSEDYDEFNFQYNDKPICPFCGYEFEPDDLYESQEELQCGNCSSYMDVEVEYTATYSTSKSK